jgi:hypothetical protein
MANIMVRLTLIVLAVVFGLLSYLDIQTKAASAFGVSIPYKKAPTVFKIVVIIKAIISFALFVLFILVK